MSTAGPLAISTVTVVEVVKGFRKVGREQEIDRFLANLSKLDVFPLDAVGAEHAGRIYGDLERLGQPIGRANPMIAGIALARGLVLVTGDRITTSGSTGPAIHSRSRTGAFRNHGSQDTSGQGIRPFCFGA